MWFFYIDFINTKKTSFKYVTYMEWNKNIYNIVKTNVGHWYGCDLGFLVGTVTTVAEPNHGWWMVEQTLFTLKKWMIFIHLILRLFLNVCNGWWWRLSYWVIIGFKDALIRSQKIFSMLLMTTSSLLLVWILAIKMTFLKFDINSHNEVN